MESTQEYLDRDQWHRETFKFPHMGGIQTVGFHQAVNNYYEDKVAASEAQLEKATTEAQRKKIQEDISWNNGILAGIAKERKSNPTLNTLFEMKSNLQNDLDALETQARLIKDIETKIYDQRYRTHAAAEVAPNACSNFVL